MLAFWEHGYEATSIAQLTGIMGIAPPSLYAAFGDKRRLFDEAVELYTKSLAGGMRRSLDAPTARAAVEGVLRDAAAHYTTSDCPRGCLVMNEPLLAGQRAKVRRAIAGRIERGCEDGDLPVGTDVERLTEFIDVVMAGMQTRARDGATRQQLGASIDQAMQAWPDFVPTVRKTASMSSGRSQRRSPPSDSERDTAGLVGTQAPRAMIVTD